MSMVRLLGFRNLACGCVSGRYRDLDTNQELSYIEEKSPHCVDSAHQRNQPVSRHRVAHGFTHVGRAS